MILKKIKAALFGMAVGDALGVPVEFKSREALRMSPVKDLTGHGSWDQPPGTWSDDSSLAFCLTESLIDGYDLKKIAGSFIQWYEKGYWGAHHKVFDVGGATRFAIERLMNGASPAVSGGMMEEDNGNGSLMRILPLLFYIRGMDIIERYRYIKEVSGITHGHFRSVFPRFIYIELALHLLNGKDKRTAYSIMQNDVNDFSNKHNFNKKELSLFERILKGNIEKEQEDSIHSSGYVLHTLEASIWCLMNSRSYGETVLKAVNPGGDTDTTGCVTGGLAGLLYGFENIPENWYSNIARQKDITDLCRLYHLSLNK